MTDCRGGRFTKKGEKAACGSTVPAVYATTVRGNCLAAVVVPGTLWVNCLAAAVGEMVPRGAEAALA